MTTLQLNADIYQNLALLSENESLLDKAAKYIRRLAKQVTKDSTCMSEEEFFARVDEAREEIRQGKGIRFTDTAEMNAWLNSL